MDPVIRVELVKTTNSLLVNTRLDMVVHGPFGVLLFGSLEELSRGFEAPRVPSGVGEEPETQDQRHTR